MLQLLLLFVVVMTRTIKMRLMRMTIKIRFMTMLLSTTTIMLITMVMTISGLPTTSAEIPVSRSSSTRSWSARTFPLISTRPSADNGQYHVMVNFSQAQVHFDTAMVSFTQTQVGFETVMVGSITQTYGHFKTAVVSFTQT